MATTPGSNRPEGEPLEEVDLPGFNPSSRKHLDPPMAGARATDDTAYRTYDPDRDLVDQLDDPFEPEDPKSPTSSSPGSIEPNLEVAESFGNLAKLLVQLLSLGLNFTIGRKTGAWIATEPEAEAIATPLGRIAERHAPISGEAAGDVADGIEAAYGVATYGVRAVVDQALITSPLAPQPGDVQ